MRAIALIMLCFFMSLVVCRLTAGATYGNHIDVWRGIGIALFLVILAFTATSKPPSE